MAIHIRFFHGPGYRIGFAIERINDGLFYDFSDGTFKAIPATRISSVAEEVAPFRGRYRQDFPTNASFSNGWYCVTFHDRDLQDLLVGQSGVSLYNGDDATSEQGGTGSDPWSMSLPGSYASGTAGAILGSLPNLTDPWTRTLPGSYPAGTAGQIVGNFLDARVSTRSTFDGSQIDSVRLPVTVGTNKDKSGYILASSGLDPVTVEDGLNARQAVATILATAAGVLSGAGTGTISIRAANSTTARIEAVTDEQGNRLSVVIHPPV